MNTSEFEALPANMRSRLESFLRVRDDDSVSVEDPRGFVAFVVENSEQYPVLPRLIKVDEEKMIEHVRETGQVPPGVKIIKTASKEGDDVTTVRIFHGPTTIPEKDRD